MLIVKSDSLDVYRNLAMEEYLLEHISGNEPILFLWRSARAVVIGKNQNPWVECRLPLMREDGVPLARRVSGGGAVYHDEGNLNYCIIVDRKAYKEPKAFEVIFRAVERLGLTAERAGQSNLCVGDRKFSGNAFCFRKGRALHHGTLLVHADLHRLGRYLGPSIEQVETKAIASVPARVCNLGDFVAGLTVEQVSEAVAVAFRELYAEDGAQGGGGDLFDEVLLAPLEARQHANEWKYGATPKFTVTMGSVDLEVRKGMVVRESGGVNKVSLVGVPFWDSSFSFKLG